MPFNLEATLGLDGSAFASGLAQAKTQARKFKGDLNEKVGGELKGQLAAAFGVGAIVAASKATIDYAGKINDLHDRVDVSREGLQKWDYALKQNGSDIESGVKFFEKIGQAREKAFGGGEEGEKALKNFRDLGVTFDDLKNKRLEDIGLQIGNAVRAGDVQKLGAALREVGGKAATELIPAFKNGLEEAFSQAPIIPEDTVAQLDDVGDAIDRLAMQFRATLAPAIVYVVDLLGKTLDFLKIIGGQLPAFLGALAGGASLKEAVTASTDVYNEVIDARIKREAEGSMKRDRKGKPFTDQELAEKEKPAKEEHVRTISADKIDIDSMAKIGAFIGRSGSAATLADKQLAVATQQLQVQQKIAANTEPSRQRQPEFSANF